MKDVTPVEVKIGTNSNSTVLCIIAGWGSLTVFCFRSNILSYIWNMMSLTLASSYLNGTAIIRTEKTNEKKINEWNIGSSYSISNVDISDSFNRRLHVTVCRSVMHCNICYYIQTGRERNVRVASRRSYTIKQLCWWESDKLRPTLSAVKHRRSDPPVGYTDWRISLGGHTTRWLMQLQAQQRVKRISSSSNGKDGVL